MLLICKECSYNNQFNESFHCAYCGFNMLDETFIDNLAKEYQILTKPQKIKDELVLVVSQYESFEKHLTSLNIPNRVVRNGYIENRVIL